MVLLDLFRNRRSIRKYRPVDVPYDILIEAIEAGRWAPSSGNLQNWRFIIVKNREKIKKIAEACNYQGFVAEAPALIVVCSNTDEVVSYYGKRGKFYAIQNVAAAIENILLYLSAKGLGSCWIGAFDEKKIKEILEVPEGVEIHAVITVGYPDEEPKSNRKPLREIVFFEKWGNTSYQPGLYPLMDTLSNLKSKIYELKEKIRKI